VHDEAALLERLRAGDERAFAELVAANDASLRRVARSFVRTASAAEDVVQETWLAVVRGLDSFEGRSSLRTWIFSILVNRARTHAAKDARSIAFSQLDWGDERPAVDPDAFGANGGWASAPPRPETDPEGQLLAAELRDGLRRAVDDLPEAQRIVITLRDLVGITAEEVAELLDITDGNQRVLLHRARSRVRTALTPALEVGV
jgi:RNA polymerase sigma-70 factor, ECF subfamily